MPPLTHADAIARAELITVHGYELDLDLRAARDAGRFGSETTVRFGCATPGAVTFAEISAESVQEIRLNGTRLEPSTVVDGRLPLADLRADNELVVRATMAYSTTGEGLYRSTDPEDGEVYLYACTCLDTAPQVFACFDQPDLKAPVVLRVSAPPDWTVRANAAGTEVSHGRWEFAETKPLATYFTTLAAGPYHAVYRDHGDVRMGLLCRRTLAGYLDADADELFGITAGCLDRYHELFGIPYPFGKYDQAFVPEFNAGAMENPGLVTFRDEFVFRSAVTDTERELRAVVVAHEMAHMWFGDLVTMRWWDDLWLNESFAEYMGWRVVTETTRFTGAWSTFAVGRKGWGYAADQRPSTHPVAPAEVGDTVEALANFDGISYAKGASILRQLVAWVGDEAFLAGVRAHFGAHAYGNATLADLLSALSAASGRDLTGWAEVWLRREQVNTLRPLTSLDGDGRYAGVTVEQTAPAGYPTLRPHRIGIGVYGDAGRTARVEVDLDPDRDGGRTPVPALTGAEPGLLLLNDGDLTFAKVRFDDAGRAALATVLPTVDDPLTRAVLWGAATDATRDAELPAGAFLDLLAAALPAETTVAVVEDVLRFGVGSVVKSYLDGSVRAAGSALVAGTCAQMLADAEPGGSRQLSAVRGLVSAAGPADVPALTGWLDGRDVPAGLAIDAELRWAVLARLVVLGAAGADAIDAESGRDRSAQAVQHAARCHAAVPTAAAKAAAWQIMMFDDSGPARLLAATAQGFWQPEHEELTAPYVARFFDEAPAMAVRRSATTVQRVGTLAYPTHAVAAGTLAAAEKMLARTDLDPTLRRVAVDATHDLRLALAARAST